MSENLKNNIESTEISCKKRFSIRQIFIRLKEKYRDLITLTKLQLSEKLKWKDNASTGYKVATIAKRVGYSVLGYACFFGIFYLIFNLFHILPSRNIFVFMLALLQILSLITCISDGSKLLYTAKDNSLLLTYPVKHKHIFESKILVLYILELLRSLTLVLPLMFAYATVVHGIFSVNFVISAILYSVFLPLIPVLLGSIIAIPFVKLTQLMKKIPWIKAVITVGIITGLIFFARFIVISIEKVAPIRIGAMFDVFIKGLEDFTGSFNKFVLYVNFLGKGMLPTSTKEMLLNHLYMILVIVGLLVISILLAMPTFFKLASSATENATAKKHHGKNVAHSSTFVTFIRKEFTMSIRNIANFVSDYVFLFALPFVLVILGVIFINIDRNDIGLSTTYGILCLIALMLVSASNTASATSISSEGSEFALIKTAPGKTSNIIWSKLLLNFVISFVMCTLSFGLLLIFSKNAIKAGTVEISKILLVYLYVSFINLGLLFWSIQLDIVNPKLREFANSQNRNEIANASQSITIGLIFSVIFSAIAIAVFLFVTNTITIGIILLCVSFGFAALRFYFLLKYRDAYFEEIQL